MSGIRNLLMVGGVVAVTKRDERSDALIAEWLQEASSFGVGIRNLLMVGPKTVTKVYNGNPIHN